MALPSIRYRCPTCRNKVTVYIDTPHKPKCWGSLDPGSPRRHDRRVMKVAQKGNQQ